jgi:5'-AMP-activated protein kinase, regulatory gamma subunit
MPTSAHSNSPSFSFVLSRSLSFHSHVGLDSAPLWDYKAADYVGVVTVTDFIDILRHFYYDSSSPSDKPKFPELERFRVREWRELLVKQRHASLIRSLPDDTLLQAAEKLVRYKIHRLPLVDPAMNNVTLTVITTESILKFLILRVGIWYHFSLVSANV